MSWIENINEKNLEEWIDEFQKANLGDHRSFELLGVLIEVYRKTQNERDQLRLECITSVGETQSALEQRDTYRELCVELLNAAKDYLPYMPTSSVNEGGANKHVKMLHVSDALKSAITKAEAILGEKQ